MKIGFVGSGNMARSLALGLETPALFSDSGSGRARELAALVGGEYATTAQIAGSCDIVVLCHKPKQLTEVAAEFGGFSGTIVSVLAATTIDALREAYPDARIVRTMPNIPVEFGSGVIAVAAESDAAPELTELFERGGLVVSVPEADFETVTAVSGCAPAFFALFAEALVRSAVARGLDADTAKQVVGQTLSGTGDALAANSMDTAGLQAAVASPGGLTERALASFDESGLQDAVDKAVATVLGA